MYILTKLAFNVYKIGLQKMCLVGVVTFFVFFFFQSSEKLKTINESLSAFKSRGNLPYVTTPRRGAGKRLSFDNAEDARQK